MKKNLTLVLLTLFFVCTLVACNSTKSGNTNEKQSATSKANEKSELVVFAAASMTETLEEIGDNYMANNPNVTLRFNFDSSGTLKKQIEEGAVCDIFISASNKQMNQLDISADKEKNPDGLDFVDSSSRFDLLENKVALVVSENNPKNIKSFDDLVKAINAKDVFMAIGNEDVPVGQYTQKIFAYYEIDENDAAANGLLTYGSNVKEVTTQISEGLADCGIIYQTDAYSAGLEIVDTASEEMCGRVIYPAAIMKNTENNAEAKAFLDFLKTKESSVIFEKVGFAPLN